MRKHGRARRPPRANDRNSVASAALIVSVAALIMSSGGLAGAAQTIIGGSGSPKRHHHASGPGIVVRLLNGRIPAKYLPKIPAKDLPTVANAKKLDGQTAAKLTGSCAPTTVDLGSWCLDASPYPLTNAEIGKNDYFWAAQACVAQGGYLPTAAQLIGAANRVKLESTINDSPLTATIEVDPRQGLIDQREMSATLVTTTAGSDAAGSEGVSVGSTGNPMLDQPNPIPEPAAPEPETLQYVTVYDNHNQGGFAGSEPVSQPENFRCAFEKISGAENQGNS
jgi:hypothetical protein